MSLLYVHWWLVTDPTTAKAALASMLGVEPGQLPEE
jgi:hypothetical protein